MPRLPATRQPPPDTHLFLGGSGARPLHFIRNSGVPAELLVLLLPVYLGQIVW